MARGKTSFQNSGGDCTEKSISSLPLLYCFQGRGAYKLSGPDNLRKAPVSGIVAGVRELPALFFLLWDVQVSFNVEIIIRMVEKFMRSNYVLFPDQQQNIGVVLNESCTSLILSSG